MTAVKTHGRAAGDLSVRTPQLTVIRRSREAGGGKEGASSTVLEPPSTGPLDAGARCRCRAAADLLQRTVAMPKPAVGRRFSGARR